MVHPINSNCCLTCVSLYIEQTDFKPITETITFQPQEGTTKEVRLEIVDDNIAESPETLRLVVQGVGGQQTSPTPINVTIIDDDLGTYLRYVPCARRMPLFVPMHANL